VLSSIPDPSKVSLTLRMSISPPLDICFILTLVFRGNAAYNATKAAVKSLTEGLAHELRQKPTKLTAHLFV